MRSGQAILNRRRALDRGHLAGLEHLESRLLLSTSATSYSIFAVEVPTTGVYNVQVYESDWTPPTNGTVTTILSGAVNATRPVDVWPTGTESADQRTTNLVTSWDVTLPAGKSLIRVNNASLKAPSPTQYSPGLSEIAPSAPSDVALAIQSSSAIQVRWMDNSGNETGFRIERRAGSGEWTLVAHTAPGVTAYMDTSVASSTQYTYRVSAMNAAGESDWSDVATAWTPDTVPAAPSGLALTVQSGSAIQLNWEDNSHNELGFRIERQTGGGDWAPLAITGANLSSYLDATVTTGVEYGYRVLAMNSAGFSAVSAAVWATPKDSLPAAPSGLVLTVQAPNAIRLNWTDHSSNETGFRIERQTGGSTWALLTTTAANTGEYLDTSVSPGTQYAYRVSAVNSAGVSSLTNVATATPTELGAASDLAGLVLTSSQVKLSWKDNSAGETGFKVRRSTDGINYTVVATTAANATTFTDTNLSDATQYHYTIVAAGSEGDAPVSPAISVTTAGLIRPGTGWTGPTETPAALGQPGQAGYDAKAIARWDVVPYQTFDGEFNVGIVAFHMNGIKEVRFSVNGGAWTVVSNMTLNVQTANHSGVGNQHDGVVEYWATLNARDFADGAIEVRAIAVPNVGEARVLGGIMSGSTSDLSGANSLFLFGNAGGSLVAPPVIHVSLGGDDATGNGLLSAPYRTLTKAVDMAASGGTILIMDAGTYRLDQGARYAFRKINSSWITIQPVGTLLTSDVIIQGDMRPRTQMLKFNNLTIDSRYGSFYNETSEFLWLNSVIYTDTGGFDTTRSGITQPVRASGRTYVTNSTFRDCVYGAANFSLVRGMAGAKIGADVWQNSRFVVNSSVDTVGGRADGWHADVIQLFGNFDNCIYYGLNATGSISAQGIFHDKTGPVEGQGYQNIAYVNLGFDGGQTQLSSWNTHVLFQNVNINSWIGFRGPSGIYTEEFRGNNVVFRASRFTGTDLLSMKLPTGVVVE